VPLSTSYLSVNINQPEGNTFNWTIETSPNIGSNFRNNETNGTKSCNISGLSYFTNYTWYVNFTDENSSLSQWYTFTTRPKYNPNPPKNFSANANGRFQIDLSWIKASNATYTYIEYNTTYVWQRNDGTVLFNGTDTSFNHDDLTQNTTYYYQAWSWNIDDNVWSENYSSKNATTKNNTIPSFSSPSPINGSTNQSLSFTWSISISDSEGDSFNWSIECSNGQSTTANAEFDGTKQLYISSLSCNTLYYVWVNATDGYDWAKAWFTFTTGSVNIPPIADAGGPYGDYVDIPITVSGSDSTDPDGKIVGYRWDWTNNGEYTAWSSSPTATYTYTIAGNYTIKLQVKDNLGEMGIDITTARIKSQEEIEEENELPVVNAGGPYYEIEGVEIFFDGSDSYDPDGSIESWFWTFGDGTRSELQTPTHTYSKEGNYTVTLKVTDNLDAINTSETFALITAKPNNPPGKPIIKGDTTGFMNMSINFSANSTDPDGDLVQYVFNWSDGTNNTVSFFVNSSTDFYTNHTYMIGGVYVITIYTLDENNATSETQLYKVEINAHKCGSLGYLIDKNGNGTYDVFYRETTGIETLVEKKDGDYLIDINDDGEWDYIYNFTTNKLSQYGSLTADNPGNFTIEAKWIILIVIVFAFSILIVSKIVIDKAEKNKNKLDTKTKTKKKKDNKKSKSKKTSKTKKDGPEEIEKEIDKLLAKKKEMS